VPPKVEDEPPPGSPIVEHPVATTVSVSAAASARTDLMSNSLRRY
jgi:hypothetical protein